MVFQIRVTGLLDVLDCGFEGAQVLPCTEGLDFTPKSEEDRRCFSMN